MKSFVGSFRNNTDFTEIDFITDDTFTHDWRFILLYLFYIAMSFFFTNDSNSNSSDRTYSTVTIFSLEVRRIKDSSFMRGEAPIQFYY